MSKQPFDYFKWSQEYFEELEQVSKQRSKIIKSNLNAQEKHSKLVTLDRISRELKGTAHFLFRRGEKYKNKR